MGLFNQIFGTNKEESNNEAQGAGKWIPLNEMEQLETLRENSNARAQVIFKHSTRCGISRMALNLFEREQLQELEGADAYFLDLIKHRNISNAIADTFGVTHQSPQLLVIRNGQVVAHASHNGISDLNAKQYA